MSKKCDILSNLYYFNNILRKAISISLTNSAIIPEKIYSNVSPKFLYRIINTDEKD